MRAYIAIALPEEIRKNLANAIDRMAPFAEGVKWAPRDQFHVVLAHLDEIAPAFIQHIAGELQKLCAATTQFDLTLEGYGYWGNKRNPESVWAAADLPPELELFQERICKMLKRYGITVPPNEFRPHALLGHCQTATPNKQLLAAMDSDQEAFFGTFPVSRVALYQSRPGPKGIIYKLLGKFPLRPSVE